MSSICFANPDGPADQVVMAEIDQYRGETTCQMVVDLIVDGMIKRAVDSATRQYDNTNIDKTLREIKKFRKLKLKQCKR